MNTQRLQDWLGPRPQKQQALPVLGQPAREMAAVLPPELLG